MTQVKLPDGSIRDLPAGASALDVARDISEGLARTAVAAKVDGVVCDLATTLPDECEVALLTPRDGESMEILRHSAAHILAQAVRRLHGEQVQYCIGPALMDDFQYGFYYDFDLGDAKITDDDLKAIEAEMKKIVKEKLPIAREDLSAADAKAKLAGLGQHYKIEMIDDMSSEEQAAGIALYTQGEFTDMCRGPHLQTTGQLGKGFKLLSVAGAYWRGDEANKMLTRIYGNAFFDKKELAAHLAKLEEAKKRDHRIIGKEMDLFLLDEKVGPGMPMWLPKGAVLRTELEAWLRGLLTKAGYSMVYSPQIGKLDLYRTSGHYPYYKDSQFPPITFEDEGHEDDGFLLRPMNCPHHVQMFKHGQHSYRDLPLRYAEFGQVYRWEQSGELNGLTRVRAFTQDDAHIFCTPEQLEAEIESCVALVQTIFETLDLTDYSVRISLRDPDSDKYVGSDENWELAEENIRHVVKKLGLDYVEQIGEAAFYGPKIDFVVTDCIGREWQLGTVQVDYNLPERFDISYIGSDNTAHRPVMIHRAPLGSFERFIGILIEHFAGDFPLWLAPTQVAVLPVSEKYDDYAQQVTQQLRDAGLRVDFDHTSDKVGAKIRRATLAKIPYMVILGEKEAEAQTVAARGRKAGDLGVMSIADFVEALAQERDTQGETSLIPAKIADEPAE
ncbi:MAG: threonine--tRNA ligase [Phycisphaerales bacterium]|jgi:threonyl-tRNA synthetase|nr:threonine--tRNA ligase [Phycisphaerales bacterium]MBT7170713.1 threonine--tRNA ligase [Phycisphaerales bacterium]